MANESLPATETASFLPELKSVDGDARRLLEEYSGIPSDQVVPHVKRIRDEAWKILSWEEVSI